MLEFKYRAVETNLKKITPTCSNMERCPASIISKPRAAKRIST
jgi:hypothetical protein